MNWLGKADQRRQAIPTPPPSPTLLFIIEKLSICIISFCCFKKQKIIMISDRQSRFSGSVAKTYGGIYLYLCVNILLLSVVGITADPSENYDTLTHIFFDNIYERNTEKMVELIETLSSDELINLLNMEYAPVGTDKKLTPLMLATVGGDVKMVKLLLEKGADPHRMCPRKIYDNEHSRKILDKENFILINGSPLWVAASFGHLDVCRALVAHGANVELGLETGNSPLMAASDAGHKDIVAFLIKNGASIGRADNVGNTALMSASIMGRMNVVRFLLSKGARIDMKNKNGKTALDLASEFGHSEIVHLLQAEQRKKAGKGDL